MPEATPLTPDALYDDLLAALRAWRATHDAHQLAHLRLVQDAVAERPGRAATHHVLRQAIATLRRDHPDNAQILTLRFVQDETVVYTANQLHLSADQTKRRQRQAIMQLAELLCTQENARRQQVDTAAPLAVPPRPATRLFGLDGACAKLLAQLLATTPPRLIVVSGMGGIGKTTLLAEGVHAAVGRQPFAPLLWANLPAADELDPARAVDLALAELGRLLPDFPAGLHGDALLAQLQRQLDGRPALVIIDNVESDAVAAALVRTLGHLPLPVRGLLGTRALPVGQPDVFHCPLDELGEADSFALLRFEGERLGLDDLAAASDALLAQITARTGGNPLALKLVAGLLVALPLDRVLADLPQAQLARTEALYTRIYRRVWQALEPEAQRVLRMMPIVAADGADPDQLQRVSGLDDRSFWIAVDQLIARSLLLARGTLTARRYAIHRLTETFLQTEINRWT